MTTKSRQNIIDVACAAMLIGGGILFLAESGALVTFLYLAVIIPAVIGLSSLAERLNPDAFTREQLQKKGLIEEDTIC